VRKEARAWEDRLACLEVGSSERVLLRLRVACVAGVGGEEGMACEEEVGRSERSRVGGHLGEWLDLLLGFPGAWDHQRCDPGVVVVGSGDLEEEEDPCGVVGLVGVGVVGASLRVLVTGRTVSFLERATFEVLVEDVGLIYCRSNSRQIKLVYEEGA
jgi:hypothetical protein